MYSRNSRRRGALTALTAAAVLLGGFTAAAANAGADATSSAAASPTIPHLGLSWDVIKHECWHVTKKVKVHHGKKVTTKKKRVRRCGNRPAKAKGRALHLAWDQRGEVFGRLTLNGQPIANASVTLSWAIPSWKRGSDTVVTDANGRFSAGLVGPNKIVTLSYAYQPGVTVAVSKKITETAHLRLNVGHLKGGHRARFSGIVFGGHIPQDLYVQFWYHDGRAGWQPFSHLALVNRRNGHWAANVPIPRDSAGYTYRIRATVVHSPDWPYSATKSRVIVRRVA